MQMPCFKFAPWSGKNFVLVEMLVGTSRCFLHRSRCHCFVVVQTVNHFFFLSNRLETTWCSLSRCPGASHQRVALERRKSSKTQTEIENENGTTVIDLPATSSPEADCSGPTLTSVSLPAWTEEPGLDNPVFEESPAGDSTCPPPVFLASSQTRRCLPPHHSLLLSQHAFSFLSKKLILRYNPHST